MRIKLLKQMLWVVNALLVVGVVGVVLKFFFLSPTNPKQPRTAEDILGEVIQQGRRKIERDKPDPPHTYRNTHELAINGAPPPPPEVIDTNGGATAVVPPLARNYELEWTMLDPRGWGSHAHLVKLPARKEYFHVEVGEKVDRAWKLIRVARDEAEFEDETSGTRVTLERKKDAPGVLDGGLAEAGASGGNAGGLETGAQLSPEEDFKRGPVKSALKKSENHWEMPREEAGWWGRHGEKAAAQIALQPEKDPATGRPDGVRVLRIEAGSVLQRRGLLPGDKIKSINGSPVNSRQDAISYVKGPGKGLNRYLVVIERKGRMITMTYDVRK